jgi:hypothetical protein
MEQEGKKKKTHFIKAFWEWIVGILFVITFLGVVFVYFFLDSIVKNRIVEGVNHASAGLYVLEIEDLTAEFWTGAIKMNNVWLRPDGTVLQKMREVDSMAYIPNVNLRLDSVSISSIRWLRYLLSNKKLEIGTVRISKPDCIVQAHLNYNSTIKESNRNFLDYLPGMIAAFTGSLRIDAIEVDEGNVHFDLHTKEGMIHQLADSIKMDIRKILIDTLSPRSALYSEKALIDIRNYRFSTPDNLSSLKIKRIYGRVEDSILTIVNINYRHKDSLNEKYPDEVHVNIKDVETKGVDFRHLLQNQKVALRTMKFKEPHVRILSSGIKPVDSSKVAAQSSDSSILNQISPYIAENFLMDSFSIENGFVSYDINSNKDKTHQSAENIYLHFTSINLDSIKQKSSKSIEDVNLKLRNYIFTKDDNLELSINSFYASVKDSLLSLKKFSFKSFGEDTFQVEAAVFKGNGMDYIEMARNKRANLEAITILNPDILIISNPSKDPTGKAKVKTRNGRKFFEESLGPLVDASLKAKNVIIKDGKITSFIRTRHSTIEQTGNNLSLIIKDLKFDSSSANRYEFYESFNLDVNQYSVKVHGENFKIDIANVQADSKNGRLDLNDVEVSQIRSYGPEQRYFFINKIKHALASNVDFERFLIWQEVHTRRLTIDEMDLRIFLDEGKAVRPSYASDMPQDLMRKLPFYLRVDTVKINNSNIAYLDQDKKLNEPGRITFERLDLLALNFTNDSTIMTDAYPATLEGKTYIMGKGLLKFRIIIPLLSKAFDTYFSGSIDTLDGKAFNSLLAFADVQITRGRILPGEFQVEINEGSAAGRLRFQYEDLHLKVINPKSHKVAKLKSLVGNFMVKNGNPKKKGDDPEIVPVCGKISNEDGFFYFMWKVLRDGIITTVTKDSVYDTFVKH